MSRFAVFYNQQDLTPIAANMSNILSSSLSAADKAMAQDVWNSGFKDWSTAPVAAQQYDPNFGTTNPSKMVVVNSTTTSLKDFINLILRIGQTVAGADYLLSIASDLTAGRDVPKAPSCISNYTGP